MTTLQAIGFTLAGGALVFMLALLGFGLALRRQSSYVAPRCAARPRNVIYNPDPTNSSQYRGSSVLGWIRWSLGLSYDEMLHGIPGTGTRKGGLEGSMLRANMDGIVMLRFHALCRRITVLATVLCILFILPMNYTARCYDEQHAGDDALLYPGCQSSDIYNLTNYDRTTLANIPALDTTSSASSVWGVSFGSLLGRMYGIAFCTWVITIYACYNLRQEWVELLAMRRVYYLEDDVWAKRKEELNQMLLKEDDSDDEDFTPMLDVAVHGRDESSRKKLRKRKNKRGIITNESGTNNRMMRREPWIPHPEQRDTVPNVSLYSVLVGNLPKLPHEAIMKDEDVEAAVGNSKKLNIDWQLSLTTSFFDQCVPNQPGFSSSVAAVTILPAASDLGRAWAKWYAAAGKLRRLRYVRSLISKKRQYDIDALSSDDEEQAEAERVNDHSFRNVAARMRTSSEIYRDSVTKKNYFREVLGTTSDEEVEANFLLSFNLGPEQFAVYSREFAQSAAACCPNGCHERRLRRTGIDELLIMEQEAIAEVQAANLALKKAQSKVIKSEYDPSAPLAPPSPLSSPSPAAIKSLALTKNMETEAALMSESSKNKSSHSRKQPLKQASHGILHEESNAVLEGSTASTDRKSHSGPTGSTPSEQWSLVESIIGEAGKKDSSTRSAESHLPTGQWRFQLSESLNFAEWFKKVLRELRNIIGHKTSKVVDTLARDTSYAVVTFTSRQAAVAARHALADGRGLGRWTAADSIPVPPLADAAPCAICPCRGCCRPVTMSVNDREKASRRYLSYVMLVTIYIFYTIPLTLATTLVDPTLWEGVFPGITEWSQSSSFYTMYLSGLLPALLWTIFFALCPLMFKSIANCGSNAASVVGAEDKALQYYWWFMVVTAYAGNSLATMVINGFSGANLGLAVQDVLAGIAAAIPTQISATWINWIIVRATITLPLHYMLQVNTFLFSFLGWNCCSRVVRGGGPGGPVPYRVFIDSGVVLMCVVALAPASPLLAPFALGHYLYCEPLMRRNLIFTYRPKFDGGGSRFPFLFEMVISSLLVGHVLMTTMLALKRAIGPAIVAALPFIPTLIFRHEILNVFRRPYNDAALLQTSLLDGWDTQQPTSMKKREDFRKFLVDAHKAAYVPVCIAGREDVMTAEPAVVIDHDNDEGSPSIITARDTPQSVSETSLSDSQFGVSMRRVTPRSLARARARRHLDRSGDGSACFSFGVPSTEVPIDEEDATNFISDETNFAPRRNLFCSQRN